MQSGLSGIMSVSWVQGAYKIAINAPADVQVVMGNDSPFMAFDEVMCSDRYIMLQAVLCNESMRDLAGPGGRRRSPNGGVWGVPETFAHALELTLDSWCTHLEV